jgi:hypothetical protein
LNKRMKQNTHTKKNRNIGKRRVKEKRKKRGCGKKGKVQNRTSRRRNNQWLCLMMTYDDVCMTYSSVRKG